MTFLSQNGPFLQNVESKVMKMMLAKDTNFISKISFRRIVYPISSQGHLFEIVIVQRNCAASQSVVQFYDKKNKIQILKIGF